jgi:hypothetical protein
VRHTAARFRFKTKSGHFGFEIRIIPIPNKKCVNFYLELEFAAYMPHRNAKHSGGKAKAHFRRSRQIKIAGRNFYLESELWVAPGIPPISSGSGY